MQKKEMAKLALWARMGVRFLCGLLAAVILSFFGRQMSDKTIPMVGMVIGMLGSLVYGEKVLGALAWFVFSGGTLGCAALLFPVDANDKETR